MMEVLAHDGIEGISKSGQVSDLLVMTAMARYEERDGYHFAGPASGQPPGGVLEIAFCSLRFPSEN